MKFDIGIVFTATSPIKIILPTLLTKGGWCLSKSKFPVCANFIHFTKKNQRCFKTKLEEIFIFTTTFLTLPSPSIEQCELAEAPTKNRFATILFQFCDLKTQQCYILQEEVNISKRQITSLVHSLRDFLKTFNHARKCIRIFQSKSKYEIGSTKSKESLFAHYYNDIIEHPNRQIRSSFRFGNNNSCVFSIKEGWTTRQSIYSSKNCQPEPSRNSPSEHEPILRCEQMWNNEEQLWCAGHSALIVGVTIALLFSLGTCIVPIQSVRVNFACPERLLNLSAEAILNVHNARLCARCAKFLFEIKRIPFFCRLIKWFTFLEKVHSQFKI